MSGKPDWQRFGRFLVGRREALGITNVDRLRRTTSRVPADKIGRQTLRNVEMGEGCSMDTFAYLPELYKVGYDELLRALWPEYEKREDRATKLFGAMPWLAVLVEQLAVASPEVQRIITKVLDVEREQIPA